MSAPVEDEVILQRSGRLGHIILNRPRALNALTHNMVKLIHAALDEWADDDTVQTVLLTGSGDRALCAGGDIVSLYKDAKDGDGRASAAFWADEYRLNARIASYPKPYVAFMDGVVLGGGIGLSAHASHRIVTERSSLGLPETGIGFIPDVGGTWLLSRAPGELGTYLGLTAGSIGAADAIALGFADSYVPSDRLDQLARDLERTAADSAIAAVTESAPDSELLGMRDWIDTAFSAGTATEIVARLRTLDTDFARQTADRIVAKSPTAVEVTLESLRRVKELPDLEAALTQEFRVSLHALAMPDFAEGVRAQVIDKDRSPGWVPAELAEVTSASVESFFAPIPYGDLVFDPSHRAIPDSNASLKEGSA